MKCSNCGNELAEGAKFCPKCGTKVAKAMPTSATPVESAKEAHIDTPNESAAPKAEPKPKKKLNKKAIVGVAALAIVAAIGGGAAYVLNWQHEQLVNSVQPQLSDALSEEYDGQTTLFASNDYVTPSDYQSSLTKVSRVDKSGDKATGTIEATFTNDSFESNATLGFTADVDDSNDLSNVEFNVESHSTKPIAGIDFDNAHMMLSCDSNLNGDDTCTVRTPADPKTPWYANSKSDNVYTYSFDGEKWQFDSQTTEDNDADGYFNENAIAGSYHCAKSDEFNDNEPFRINYFDKDANKVSVDVNLSFKNLKTGSTGTFSISNQEAEIVTFGNDIYGFSFAAKDDSGNYIFMTVALNPNVDHGLSIYRGTYKDVQFAGIQASYTSKYVSKTDSYLEKAGLFPLGYSLAAEGLPDPLFVRD